MAAAKNQTVETGGDVAAFDAAVPDEAQRADAQALIALMARVSGAPPKMWGPAIIGFGSYHYKYDSGREGDMPRIAFSPRKGKTTLYLAPYLVTKSSLMAKLGKHTAGKGCLYIKRLSDVDATVLEALLEQSLDRTPQS